MIDAGIQQRSHSKIQGGVRIGNAVLKPYSTGFYMLLFLFRLFSRLIPEANYCQGQVQLRHYDERRRRNHKLGGAVAGVAILWALALHEVRRCSSRGESEPTGSLRTAAKRTTERQLLPDAVNKLLP